MGLYGHAKSSRIIKAVLFFCAVLLLAELTACTGRKMDRVKRIFRGRVESTKIDTGLPVIRINTHNGRAIADTETYVTADMEITDPNNSFNNLKSTVEIRGRGNASWNLYKSPYRLRFFGKTSLFGYDKAKSWVLLTSYRDPTLIMNTVAFELGKRFNIPFTHHYTHVEVIFNGQYAGSYVLTEQVQVGKGRVDIDKNRGFLVELDRRYDDDPKFRTDILGLPVMIKSPEDSGYDFVKDAINELEAAIFSPEFPENGYRELINVNSFIDYLLINDMLMNWELQVPSSVFMYKDKDEKISMGPLWDFDGGFGYEDDGKTFFTRIEERIPFSSMRAGQGGRFFQRFFEDPYFREKYKNRWNEKYADIAAMEAFIDQMAEALDKSQEMNYKVWWWKKVNYKDEIEKMKIWWRARIDYLNTEINK